MRIFKTCRLAGEFMPTRAISAFALSALQLSTLALSALALSALALPAQALSAQPPPPPALPAQQPPPRGALAARLALPDFAVLAQKATQSVVITLDAPLLAIAGQFLDTSDPRDAATKEVIQGLQGIYVRSYTFDQDLAYRQSDIDAVRQQLSAPGWARLVETRSKKTRSDVDIYIRLENKQAVGLAVIASEPRQFTIVNIVGAIDLDKLHKLEGQFGVPKFDVDASKPAPIPGSAAH